MHGENEPIPMNRDIRVDCIIDREDFSWFEKEPYRSILPFEKDTIITYEGRLLQFDLYTSHRVTGDGLSFGVVLDDCRVVLIDGEPILAPVQ